MPPQNAARATPAATERDPQNLVGTAKRDEHSDNEALDTTQVLRAELIGNDTCVANKIEARGHSPVLVMCRELLAAGLNPDTALEVFRGAVLALRVRSIGEGAGLEVNAKGTGFAVRRASLTRKIKKSDPDHREAA
jgi:hypothetical protein